MGEQQRYQVRFDWGVEGAWVIGEDADVLVWVDARGDSPADLQRLPSEPAVIETGFPTAVAVAAWVLHLQEARQLRTSVAIVAAGATRAGTPRFRIEDLLAAGAIIDALEAIGIDAMSPEAAVADAAYRTLKPGVGPLTSAAAGANGIPAPPIDRTATPDDVQVRRPPRPHLLD